jgi:hypothetical protein
MGTDGDEAIQALLSEAQEAHGAYEASELNGVYDEQWPQWYATYAVEHGIGPLLGHEVTAEGLAQFLGVSYTEYQALDPRPSESWAQYTARRLAAEL